MRIKIMKKTRSKRTSKSWIFVLKNTQS